MQELAPMGQNIYSPTVPPLKGGRDSGGGCYNVEGGFPTIMHPEEVQQILIYS